jgi:hypothetical protein
MKWRKLGLIFVPQGGGGWMQSHAQVPTVLVLQDRLRVYFASRPKRDLSLTTFIDLDRSNPMRILSLNTEPILSLGQPGTFDEHGIMPSFVTMMANKVWLYYGGWSRRESVPYSNWTGLAISEDNGATFRRMFTGPIIDRTPTELYSATAPNILKDNGTFHMWYASGVSWETVDGRLEEYYTIKHGVSVDGINWHRDGSEVFESSGPLEPKHRPAVFRHDSKFIMLFGKRKIHGFRDGPNGYRIGYAESVDLKHWSRDDSKAGIEPSQDGWDSTMTAYPYVVTVDKRTLLFYNGNGFGETGFGVAELQS